MEWGEVRGCAEPRRKGVGLRGLGRPQEATVMTLGRAEEFLSWDDGRGWGGRRSCSPPC